MTRFPDAGPDELAWIEQRWDGPPPDDALAIVRAEGQPSPRYCAWLAVQTIEGNLESADRDLRAALNRGANLPALAQAMEAVRDWVVQLEIARKVLARYDGGAA